MLFRSTPLRFRPCELFPILLPHRIVRRTPWSLACIDCVFTVINPPQSSSLVATAILFTIWPQSSSLVATAILFTIWPQSSSLVATAILFTIWPQSSSLVATAILFTIWLCDLQRSFPESCAANPVVTRFDGFRRLDWFWNTGSSFHNQKGSASANTRIGQNTSPQTQEKIPQSPTTNNQAHDMQEHTRQQKGSTESGLSQHATSTLEVRWLNRRIQRFSSHSTLSPCCLGNTRSQPLRGWCPILWIVDVSCSTSAIQCNFAAIQNCSAGKVLRLRIVEVWSWTWVAPELLTDSSCIWPRIIPKLSHCRIPKLSHGQFFNSRLTVSSQQILLNSSILDNILLCSRKIIFLNSI